MAFAVTAAKSLAQVPLEGGGSLTFYQVVSTLGGGDAGFTMTELSAGLVSAIDDLYNLTGASLVSVWDAGGDMQDANGGAYPVLTPGAGSAGAVRLIGMKGATSGDPTTSNGASAFIFIAAIRL